MLRSVQVKIGWKPIDAATTKPRIMKTNTFLLLTALLLSAVGSAQAQTDSTLPFRRIYVIRPSQYVGALVKIKVNVNGHLIPMANDTYAMLDLRADSVILQIVNTRLAGESILPLVTFKDTSYFIAIPEEHAHKKDRLILTEIDKESYDKYAQKTTKRVILTNMLVQ
jgi:hypothetical protein